MTKEEEKDIEYLRALAHIHPGDRTPRQQKRFEELWIKYRKK